MSESLWTFGAHAILDLCDELGRSPKNSASLKLGQKVLLEAHTGLSGAHLEDAVDAFGNVANLDGCYDATIALLAP